MNVTDEHLAALDEAIGEAESEMADEGKLANWGRGAKSYVAQHESRAKLANERAARLTELRTMLAPTVGNE